MCAHACIYSVIGLSLVVSEQRESFAKSGGYTYLSRALSYTRNMGVWETTDSPSLSPAKMSFASSKPLSLLARRVPDIKTSVSAGSSSPGPSHTQQQLPETTYNALLSFILTPSGTYIIYFATMTYAHMRLEEGFVLKLTQ